MVTFKPRLTKPEKGNKYYITKANGGYSPCIKGKPVDKDCDVLSNCVGYAVGRFNEIGGYGYCKYLCSTNAENFIQYNNLTVGQTPKVGAVMVWQKGPTLNGSDGAGHVSIVEQVISDTEVVVSESGYNSYAFRTKTRKKATYGNWGAGSDYTFLGFIYNPAECCKDSNPAEEVVYKVGDIVYFTGTKHYENSITTTAKTCKPGKAKVTVTYPKGKHPYHLVAVAGGGSDVCGWVNTADILKTTQIELPVLRNGATGDAVKALQLLLIGRKYTCGGNGADGKFGDATHDAVRRFQKANGLTTDGVVGSTTWKKLLGV